MPGLKQTFFFPVHFLHTLSSKTETSLRGVNWAKPPSGLWASHQGFRISNYLMNFRVYLALEPHETMGLTTDREKSSFNLMQYLTARIELPKLKKLQIFAWFLFMSNLNNFERALRIFWIYKTVSNSAVPYFQLRLDSLKILFKFYDAKLINSFGNKVF